MAQPKTTNKTTSKASTAKRTYTRKQSTVPSEVKAESNSSQEAVYTAVGRRKASVARVKLVAGKGESQINGKILSEVLNSDELRQLVLTPFNLTGTLNDYYFMAKVTGGGMMGQLIAIRHGVSRALSEANQDFRRTLAVNKMLTRDPREKERKKYFFVRARKKPQFSKR